MSARTKRKPDHPARSRGRPSSCEEGKRQLQDLPSSLEEGKRQLQDLPSSLEEGWRPKAAGVVTVIDTTSGVVTVVDITSGVVIVVATTSSPTSSLRRPAPPRLSAPCRRACGAPARRSRRSRNRAASSLPYPTTSVRARRFFRRLPARPLHRATAPRTPLRTASPRPR